MKKAVLYKKLNNGQVQCSACNHFCKLSPGKTGICGVRKNIHGELFLLVYGKPATIHIDPIEKKPFYHFLPGTDVFSIGTVGCNFHCHFCQNWDISQVVSGISNTTPISPTQIVRKVEEHKVASIAYTYNEPTIFTEYAYDIAKIAHKKNIKNVYVTNGYLSKETLNYIKPVLDAANVDLKSFSDKFYQRVCGARLQPVLVTIENLFKAGIWVEITTLIIPGENDSDKELNSIAKFISSISKDIPWHISRFYPTYKMLNNEITPITTLKKAYEIGKTHGLKYIYVGNVELKNFSDTHCPICNKTLIRRSFCGTEETLIKNGKCPYCNAKIPGVWK